jgi:hypothetical protein
MLCPNGHENAGGQAFCGTCGAPLAEAADSDFEAEGTTESATAREVVPTATPATGGGSKLPWIIAVLAVLALVAIGGVLLLGDDNPSDEPRPRELFNLKGSLSAPECGGGYAIEFASVEIRDQQDRLIGSTTTSGDSGGGGSCAVDFATEVPKATFYQITIGTHGGPSYSFEEMQNMDFTVALSLD